MVSRAVASRSRVRGNVGRSALTSRQRLAFDTFDRSRNLAAPFDPSFATNRANAFPNGAGTSTITRDTTVGRSDSFSWKVVTDGTASTQGIGNLGSSLDGTPAATAGQVYTASVYVRGNAGGEQLHAEMRFADPGSALITTIAGPANATVVSSGWTRLTVTATAPAGTAFVTVKAVTNGSSAYTYWADDAQIELGPSATPFTWGDSTHLGSSDSGHAWTDNQGSYGITAAAAAYTATPAISTVDVGLADHDVRADVTFAGQTAGVVARFTDVNNFLHVRFVGGAVDITPFVNGVSNSLFSGGSYTGTHNIRVALTGTTATVYVDGTPLAAVTISGALTGTRVGLRATSSLGATFDNFDVQMAP